jgi:hypothetical protein
MMTDREIRRRSSLFPAEDAGIPDNAVAPGQALEELRRLQRSIFRPRSSLYSTGGRIMIGFYLIVGVPFVGWLNVQTLLHDSSFMSFFTSFTIAVILAGSAVVMTIAYRKERRIWRLARNLCPVCAYNLRATPSHCPECGWVIGR